MSSDQTITLSGSATGTVREPTEAERAAFDARQAARLDLLVLQEQVDSLRTALLRVLDTRNKEAKAAMSYRNARENFSDCVDERKAHERAMLAASDAELQARVLLLTLRPSVPLTP